MRALFGLTIRDARGTTAVEYALIAGLVAVVIAVAVGAVGGNLQNIFNTVAVTY